jgi:hypothetical protein
MSPEGEQGVNTAQSTEPEMSNAPTEDIEVKENIETLGLPEEDQGTAGRVGEFLKKPPVGAGIAGGLVLGVASVFGVLESAIAAGAAYAAYRVLRKKEPSSES